MQDVVLVMDFDHDTSRTVARMLRAERVNCKIIPGDTEAARVFAMNPQGIILSAAPGKHGEMDAALLENSVPILALGGMACKMTVLLGGETGKGTQSVGLQTIHWGDCPLFGAMDETERMLKQVCTWSLPPILMPSAKTKEHTISYMHMARPFYGLQLDMDPNAPEDAQILRNFAVEICGCNEEWTEIAFVENAIDRIREKVGDGRALCCVTGGLDSALSAVLCQAALGDRMRCLFVDTGFLRQGEAEQFIRCCEEELELKVTVAREEKRFMQALDGVDGREEKRQIIQHTMHNVVKEWAEKLGGFGYFIKGTNCSDKIYSGSTSSIEPDGMEVLEPLEDLFKPEIKQVAYSAGMPDWFIRRQPFPSAGLALRITGQVNAENLEIVRFADHAFAQELNNTGAAKRLYQYYAVLLPKDHTVVLRALQSGEGALAPAARLPYDVIETVTERILQENGQVAHVVYDMTPGNYFANAEW